MKTIDKEHFVNLVLKQKMLDLTNREAEIAYYLINPIKIKNIAEILHVAESTMTGHRGNVFSKFQVNSRMELLWKLKELKLLKIEFEGN